MTLAVDVRRSNSPVPRALRVVRGGDPEGALEMISAEPDPRLRDVVLDYTGYHERTSGPVRRRELPWPGVVLIFDFGPTLRFLDPAGEAVVARHAGGFLAGLHDGTVLTETAGEQSGLHVNLTPLGARRLLGMPMAELANRVVGVEDAFGPGGRRLSEALREAPGWAARFDLLDAAIAGRLAEAEAPAGGAA